MRFMSSTVSISWISPTGTIAKSSTFICQQSTISFLIRCLISIRNPNYFTVFSLFISTIYILNSSISCTSSIVDSYWILSSLVNFSLFRFSSFSSFLHFLTHTSFANFTTYFKELKFLTFRTNTFKFLKISKFGTKSCWGSSSLCLLNYLLYYLLCLFITLWCHLNNLHSLIFILCSACLY
jgi:hypothetical protein